MSTEELIQELAGITSNFVNGVNIKLNDLSETFNEFSSKYNKVFWELLQCKISNFHQFSRNIHLERNAAIDSQYSRTETMELKPVHADVHVDVLEEIICNALSLAGVNVVPDDLNACHRMRRSSRQCNGKI